MGSDQISTVLEPGDDYFEKPQHAFHHQFNAGAHHVHPISRCRTYTCCADCFNASWECVALARLCIMTNPRLMPCLPLIICWVSIFRVSSSAEDVCMRSRAGVTFLRHTRRTIDLMDAWKVEMDAGHQAMNQDALNKVQVCWL